MSLEPLLAARPPIPFHAMLAILAFFIGGLQLALPKGTSVHRFMGRAWVLSMGLVAMSGLLIPTAFPNLAIGPFGPIHALCILTLLGLVRLVQSAQSDEIAAHKRMAGILYFMALVVTGLATFAPGRVMLEVVTGSSL